MNKFFGFCVLFTKKKNIQLKKLVHLHFSEYTLLNK